MSRTPDEQIKQLKRTIAEIEAQRMIIGDAAVDAALIPFKQKLAQLEAFEDLTETFAQKGYRWEHAHSLCDWGDALVSRGEPPDLEAARKLYNQAVEIYDDLKVSWYRKQVEKRLDLITKILPKQ